MRLRFCLAVILGLSACAAQQRVTAPYCAPPNAEAMMRLEAGPALAAGSAREEQLAALLGLSEALSERATGPLSSDTRLQVLTRLELARLEVSAITAELDCDGERTSQAADYLEQRQSGTVQIVTVASILTATAVGVASVLLSTGNAAAGLQNGVGISGAAVAAGLGFATLYVSPTVHFEHTRNLLRDIWEAPAVSSVYPPIVWSYLSRPEFSNAQDAAIRSKIIDRFCRFDAGCDDPGTLALVFGEGGRFDVDTLRVQAALLDQVKAEVDLQNQDLKVLADRLLR